MTEERIDDGMLFQHIGRASEKARSLKQVWIMVLGDVGLLSIRDQVNRGRIRDYLLQHEL